MIQIKARGQITIVDQNDSVSFQAFIGSNQPTTQIYTKDTNSYAPDWSTGAFLVLTPQLFVSGTPGDSISIAGRVKPTSVVWRKDGVVLTNGGNYIINPAIPFTLTVKSNDNVGGGNCKYQFSATFTDPNTGFDTDFSTVISFNTVMNAGAGLIAVATAPDGVVFKNAQVLTLRLHGDLYRGNQVDNTLVTYKWGQQQVGIFAPTTTSAASAANATTLTLTSVTNTNVGEYLVVGGTQYTISAINTGTKVVTLTTPLVGAVASGVAVTNPYYDADLGVNWAKIDGTPYFNGITNYTTNEITIPNTAVLNLEQFKICIIDNDPASGTTNQKAFDIITLNDFSDPITIDIAAPQGSVIKNGAGSIQLTAKVWQAGAEIDAAGTGYTYQWVRYDNGGTVDGTFNPTTKTITVTPANVNGKATFECRLMSLS